MSSHTHTQLLDSVLGLDARAWGKAAALPAALRILQTLEPAAGPEVPVYPPSYPGTNNSDPPIYDLNGKQLLSNGEVSHYLHCVIDSYQSQANRMEPAFAGGDLANLVPQIQVTVPRAVDARPEMTEQPVSIFEIAHRVADFRVRLSDRQDDVKKWIRSFDDGDALPLIRHLPTSVLFGFWDSRDLGTKHARVLMSRIDAYDVVPCTRRSIYSGMYSKEEFLKVIGADGSADDKTLSERGFTNAPGSGLGGVLVRGGITRTSVLSLTDIARLHCLKDGKCDAPLTNAARRYIFALGLLAESYPREIGSFNLRSGCELVATGDVTYDLRGGMANDALLALCQDSEALVEIARESGRHLGVSETDARWTVNRDSLRREFDEAAGKKAAKQAAKKGAKTAPTNEQS
jgi:CRISPR-associated protein Csb1